MFQGFYDLTSNMITQNRNLNVISNNMTNVSTPGYKSDTVIQGTFRDQMIYRFDKTGRTPIGTASRVNTAVERVTDYSDGGLKETGSNLDLALQGNGFFVIQSGNGNVYTRDGSFNLDNQGYLRLDGVGRVMGTNGTIRLTTDEISVDGQGNIRSIDGRQYFGTLRLVDFGDYNQLTKITGGVFRANAQPQNADVAVKQKYIEDSNVSMIDEMTAMMTSQRSLQSAAQVLRMYDQIISKAAQIGSM